MAVQTPVRRRGRPRLSPSGEPSTEVSFRLPVGMYDRMYAEAARQQVSVAEMIRRAVNLVMKNSVSCQDRAQ